MEISFGSRDLRDYCLRPDQASLPDLSLESVKACLADLQAVFCIQDMPASVWFDSAISGRVEVVIDAEWVLVGELLPVAAGASAVTPFKDATRIRVDGFQRRGTDR